jgi:hypothetical protein
VAEDGERDGGENLLVLHTGVLSWFRSNAWVHWGMGQALPMSEVGVVVAGRRVVNLTRRDGEIGWPR